MSYNKNTVILSNLSAIKRVLEQTGIPYNLTTLAWVEGKGRNDLGPYAIKKLAYSDRVVLEQMIRTEDCDTDDLLVSYEFKAEDEPKDWKALKKEGYEEPSPFTQANIISLAQAVVDSWDMDTLLTFAQDQLELTYNDNPEVFFDDWEEHREEIEREEA